MTTTNNTPTRRQRIRRLAPTALSGAALFLALTGAAVALPGTETVNSGDIKDNTIRSKDIKDGKGVTGVDVKDETLDGTDVLDGSIASTDVTDESLTGGDVDDGSLSGADVADGTLTGDDIADETVGANDIGANSVLSGDIVDGQVQGDELGGFYRILGTTVLSGGAANNGNWLHGSAVASCLPGDQLIGGGGNWTTEANTDAVALVEIVPDFTTNAVSVKGAHDESSETLRAIALCLSA